MALLALLLLGGLFLQLAQPAIIARFIDSARTGASQDILAGLAVLFLVAAATLQTVQVTEAYLAASVGLLATTTLRADVTLHCLRLDPSFHSTHTPGELIERVDGDVALLGNFLSRFAVQVAGGVLLVAGVLWALYGIDTGIGIAFSVLSVLAIGALRVVQPLPVPLRARARQASARLFGYIEERLSGTEDLRALGAVPYTMRGLYAHMRDLLRAERTVALVGSATGDGTTIVFVLAGALAFVLCAARFSAGEMSLGTVFVVITYTELLRRPIEQISREAQDLQRASAAIGRIATLMNQRPSIQDGAGTPIPDGALSVHLEGVSFSYDLGAGRTGVGSPDQEDASGRTTFESVERDVVLRNVSLALAPCETLGVVGRTGSGKTTLSRLLFRLHDPTHGTVRLGGVDLRDARVDDVRRRVGTVTQDVQLFHAPVRDNLTFFERSIPDGRVLDALEALQLSEWLAGLPRGLDTVLAGRGGLSAGEAQLLAFARVFLKDPGLVILDEASSRLDPETERRVQRAVETLFAGRTAIVIAHRLSTLARVDKVLVLEGGSVAEVGARADLAGRADSRFAKLLRAGGLA